MSEKHTPGPWVSPDRPSDLSVWATKEGKTELIAETNINQWCKEAEAHANAKLMAASPDLLEALRLALPYVEGAYVGAFPDDDHNENVLETVKAAIDKATL